MRKINFLLLVASLFYSTQNSAQHQHQPEIPQLLPIVENVESQPLFAQVTRLNEALTFLGSSLSAQDAKRLKDMGTQHDGDMVKEIQHILDPYCLAMVDINPEARVKVLRGPAKARLLQDGWTSFLIKVRNDAGVTAQLNVESPNAYPVLYLSTGKPHVKEENILTRDQVAKSFPGNEYVPQPSLTAGSFRARFGVCGAAGIQQGCR